LSNMAEYSAAIEQYKAAVGINPRLAGAYRSWGDALRYVGRSDEARALYTKATEIVPVTADEHAQRGVAFASLGGITEATKEYEAAVTINPRLAWVYNRWGDALSKMRPNMASAQYTRATAIVPVTADEHAQRGVALASLGRDKEAIEEYREAVKINRKLAWVY